MTGTYWAPHAPGEEKERGGEKPSSGPRILICILTHPQPTHLVLMQGEGAYFAPQRPLVTQLAQVSHRLVVAVDIDGPYTLGLRLKRNAGSDK